MRKKLSILLIIAICLTIQSLAQSRIYGGLCIGTNATSLIKTLRVSLPTGNQFYPQYVHEMEFQLTRQRPISAFVGYQKNKFTTEIELIVNSSSSNQHSEDGLDFPFFPPFGDGKPYTRFYSSKTQETAVTSRVLYTLAACQFSPYLALGINLSHTGLTYFYEEDYEDERTTISAQLYDNISGGLYLGLGFDVELIQDLNLRAEGGYYATRYSPNEIDIQVLYTDKNTSEITTKHTESRYPLTIHNSTKNISTLLPMAKIGLTYNFKNIKP